MKKTIALLLALIMLIGVITVVPITVTAKEPPLPEKCIELPVDGTSAQGNFKTAGDVEYFKFTIKTAGKIYFDVKSESAKKGQKVKGTVYNEDMSTIEMSIAQSVNGYYEFENSCEVIDSGTYILKLTSDTPYPFTVKCDVVTYGDLGEAAQEPNNTFAEAKPVAENQTVSGVLCKHDVYDIYSFTLKEKQKLILYRDAYLFTDPAISTMLPLRINFFNSYRRKIDDKKIKYRSYSSKDSSGKEWSHVVEYIFNPGTYYMTLNFDSVSYKDIYVFKYELKKPSPLITVNGNLAPPSYEKITMEVTDAVKLGISGAKVLKWTVEKPKVLRINKKAKIIALSSGYSYVTAKLKSGKKIKCCFYVKNDPIFTYKSNPITYVTLKKGKTKNIGINGKVYNINNTYKSNSYVKVKGKKSDQMFKIKGIKKGLSVIKVRINKNWYRLTVRVK